MNIDKAALEYAQKHSSAPDKETPDWVIADFKAGAKWYANEIEQLLIDLEEYFDDRADADFDYERGFIPNEEMNTNGQCTRCNCFLSGNLINYRSGLVKRYGEERVLILESWSNKIKKWSRFELEILIEELNKDIKKL